MQWEQPPKTLLCSQCDKIFAIVYLDYDKKLYCDDCARPYVNGILTNAPTDKPITDLLTFRHVDGGMEGSTEVNISKLKSKPWPLHFEHDDED